MTVLTTEPSLEAVLEQLTAELERWDVSALELAVVQDGNVVDADVLGAGSASTLSSSTLSSSTLFHHGSCGKAYTGLLAALLAEQGVVDLDAPVRRYVSELRLPDPVVADRVTLRDLLSHRSGLGRHDLAWIFNPSWSDEDCIARLAHLPLVGDLRAQWAYSNFGYTLAGVALGRAAGDSWHTLLRKHVLEPLGMTRSITSESAAQADPDHADAYLLRDGKPVATDWLVFDALAAAGGVISSADDSVRWLLAQLGGDGVSPAAIPAAQQPQMLLPAGMSPFPELQFMSYGLGWVSGTYRGRRLVWHNGGVHGFITQTLLLPEQNIGVLACANLYPTSYPLAVVLHVADALLGETADDQSWFDRLRPEQPDNPEVPAQPGPAAAYAHPLPDYTGRYHHDGYGDLFVELTKDAIHVQVGECDVTARHRHYETWDVRYEPLEADFTLTFAASPDGTVAGAVVEFEPGTPVRFERASGEDTP